MDNIKLFKLNSGFEIISKIKEETDQYYVLESPRGISIVHGKDQTSYGLQLVPYSLSAPDGNHKLYTTSIESECVDIPDDIEKDYIRSVSRIQLIN